MASSSLPLSLRRRCRRASVAGSATRCPTYNVVVQEQNAPALQGPPQQPFSATCFLIRAFGQQGR